MRLNVIFVLSIALSLAGFSASEDPTRPPAGTRGGIGTSANATPLAGSKRVRFIQTAQEMPRPPAPHRRFTPAIPESYFDRFMRGLPNAEQLKEHLDKFVIGHDGVKLRLITAVLDHYHILRHQHTHSHKPDYVELDKPCALLVGGTGTGKTYLIETLAKHLNVPFVIADASVFTVEGYIGGKADSVFKSLLDKAHGDIELAHTGIIFFDEIDKLARTKKAGEKDISGDVQNQLLKMLTGKHIEVDSREYPDSVIDTRKILFVMAGAFSSMPTAKKTDVDVSELIRYGMTPEFIGRISCILKLDELTKPLMLRILTEPSNAPLKQQTTKFSWKGVKLVLTDGAKDAIVEEALKRKLGARDLTAILSSCLDDIRISTDRLRDALTEDRTLSIDETYIKSHLPKEIEKEERLLKYTEKFEEEDRLEALREEEAAARVEHALKKGTRPSFYG